MKRTLAVIGISVTLSAACLQVHHSKETLKAWHEWGMQHPKWQQAKVLPKVCDRAPLMFEEAHTNDLLQEPVELEKSSMDAELPQIQTEAYSTAEIAIPADLGAHLVYSNFSKPAVAPVPEPSTFVLMGIGLILGRKVMR
jgi:hypothetical protein